MIALALSLALVGPQAVTDPEPISHSVSETAEAKAVFGYWTGARMNAARPAAPRKGSAAPAFQRTGTPTAVARNVAPLAIKGTAQPRSIGRVFFTLGGQDYSCSASVVNSRGRNLLATAAHCVYGNRQWVRNWIFIPGYAYSKGQHLKPYGVWTMAKVAIEPEWAKSYDPDYDYAFVTVGKVSGRNIANVVGGQGILWNQPAKISMRIFGYPAEYPWAGTKVVSCGQTTALYTVPSAGIARHRFARCPLNGGSSGGPWIRGYSTATGTGYLVGVQSMKWMNADGATVWNSSPYLGDRAYKLYLKLGR
ncbi:trypsin-like serine protease [Planomonospora sp. ID67723]|uniref:trypsin-like serine peptidase n=1 Tax=Planomonospora sp. ID67723 TaxID=2738134 RepID=UPI0018C40BB1|nr:trypsin-like peptidase domain-containing protein [Planomonospora sp. ID67723]MBG0830698.1 trypsin-like serine protease [Planomonospora sp. ID67723]